MRTIRNILKLLRIKQWVKNMFIFFPILFSGKIFIPATLHDCILTFAAFCCASSSIYILNDFLDAKKDLHHPKKSNRPFVQNPSSIRFVIPVILGAQLLAFYLAKSVDISVALVLLTYLLVNYIYNFYAKRLVIVDVIFIAFGFHLRIWAGSLATQVAPSVWLQMCVFLLALFLGFTKRRHEIFILKDKAAEHRSVLAHYTSYLLDQIIIICSTLAIVFYGLYTMSSEITLKTGNNFMVYSIAFVIYGIFRYLYLIHVKNLGGDPGEILFSDIPLILCILAWISYISIAIYY